MKRKTKRRIHYNIRLCTYKMRPKNSEKKKTEYAKESFVERDKHCMKWPYHIHVLIPETVEPKTQKGNGAKMLKTQQWTKMESSRTT